VAVQHVRALQRFPDVLDVRIAKQPLVFASPG
jgi:hypothetical protein